MNYNKKYHTKNHFLFNFKKIKSKLKIKINNIKSKHNKFQMKIKIKNNNINLKFYQLKNLIKQNEILKYNF